MRHHRLHGRFAGVIECHGNDTAKDLERSAIPVFDYFVVCGKPGIDKVSESIANLIARVPLSNAEATGRILEKTIEPLTEGLVVDFFPES